VIVTRVVDLYTLGTKDFSHVVYLI